MGQSPSPATNCIFNTANMSDEFPKVATYDVWKWKKAKDTCSSYFPKPKSQRKRPTSHCFINATTIGPLLAAWWSLFQFAPALQEGHRLLPMRGRDRPALERTSSSVLSHSRTPFFVAVQRSLLCVSQILSCTCNCCTVSPAHGFFTSNPDSRPAPKGGEKKERERRKQSRKPTVLPRWPLGWGKVKDHFICSTAPYYGLWLLERQSCSAAHKFS